MYNSSSKFSPQAVSTLQVRTLSVMEQLSSYLLILALEGNV